MTQHLSDESPTVAVEDRTRIHRLAVLAVVFALLVPPVGIVLAVLVLRRTQRATGDGRLAISALLLAVVVLIGEVVLLIALTTSSSTAGASAAASSSAAAASSSAAAADSSAAASAGGTAPAGGAADPKGVVTACGVVMPALGQVRTDVGKVKSADEYTEVLTQLATTVVTGAASTSDPTFLQHVGQLSQAFQKAWQDSSNGKAPSAVADELTAAGTPVSQDCTAAGYHP